MPSLHFGYSLLIGVTIATVPLSAHSKPILSNRVGLRFALPSWRRLVCVVLGVAYPLAILAAIIATANHFVLDAVAGACVCVLGWKANSVLLNLLPVEDYFLWMLRLCKPVLS
jgi:PAP2 superfamily